MFSFKRIFTFLLLNAAVAAGFMALPALAQSPDYLSFKTEDEANNMEIFRKASPSVVYVTNTAILERRIGWLTMNQQEVPRGSGTGFIWDKNGLVVTNFHVVQGASRILITLQDQSNWEAKVIGLAPDKDLALLKIEAPAAQLTPIPLGDSSQLEVGRKVIAIGNPFGLDTTLTVGVVSALGREIDSLSKRKIRGVIQTDASINPGNSGGPLLNSLGQLVGVNTQIVSPSGASAGIGFAIPVNTVKKVIPQLVAYGREVRPILGISNFEDNVARRLGVQGVIVNRVSKGLGAEAAGIIGTQRNFRGDILLGDIIVEIDGIAVNNADDMLNALEQRKPGDKVRVKTLRNREEKQFTVTLSSPVTD